VSEEGESRLALLQRHAEGKIRGVVGLSHASKLMTGQPRRVLRGLSSGAL
jgi:hypothetical protein